MSDNLTGDIAVTMAGILGTMVACLAGLTLLQTPNASSNGRFFPDPQRQPSKFSYEVFCAAYTPCWIAAFGAVVVFQWYEQFTAHTYWQFCGAVALPFVLQPFLWPSAGQPHNPDAQRPWHQRYACKANLWLAVYSFIGNYWYTHYFYSVLKAEYTMPAHRLNNVPIAMFLATHFYFSTYHFFSNALLRKVVTSYQATSMRTILYVAVVVTFSYFTAFMETLTISSYPYYDFEDRTMAYTVGSAFYGIYFLVSFPAFLEFDDDIDQDITTTNTTTNSKTTTNTTTNTTKPVTLWDTFVSSCGHGMMILCLLDFVRLYLDIPLIVGLMPKDMSLMTCMSDCKRQ